MVVATYVCSLATVYGDCGHWQNIYAQMSKTKRSTRYEVDATRVITSNRNLATTSRQLDHMHGDSGFRKSPQSAGSMSDRRRFTTLPFSCCMISAAHMQTESTQSDRLCNETFYLCSYNDGVSAGFYVFALTVSVGGSVSSAIM